MSILAWIEDQKRLKLLNAPKYVNPACDSSKGLWTRCDKCGVILYIKHLKENQRVCFGCSYHLQMSSQERVENILDKDSWRPLDETLSPCDPLEFQDQKEYTDRLQDAQERTGLQDAIQTGTGMVDGIPVALGVMDFDFMGGSMGSVVGEKITRLIEYATQEGLPLLLVSASGGARMQEGVFSLMQMAKISSALQIYQSCANLLYISILTSPTTGGVTASFAMLGDIILAEPKALIAFAGRRVIEQTLCEDLPDDFQTSEYMLHHGLVDLIVPRRFLRQALSESISLYKNAPFKNRGRIPFGVQNPINFITEEKLRRRWKSIAPSESMITKGELDRPEDKYSSTLVKDKKLDPGIQSDSSLQTIAALNAENTTLCSTTQYREVLTDFQTLFKLFSKQIAVPYSLEKPTNISVPTLNISTRHSQENTLSRKESNSQQTSINLLDQAIELATTESVEWRAFYLHQKFAQRIPFIEDSLQSENATPENKIKSTSQHTLFYRAICADI
uniref:beta subunit of acetyl-CoA carboxylase carboxytransferase n=1 Tax=Calidiella yingdensis TaxID=3031288 RepID=UPI002411361D|nr:beta subunit of acetyl-CoA carboxylase carboxytransferase [Calidiella yingdensis]WDY13067.1 beta subunit of acetyl-CoA carboxylase carboxytransferase [Calidiella yingdensis]